MYKKANQIENIDNLRQSERGLYFVEKSNYCRETIGRECNPNSSGSDSCDKLCCGRGHKKQTKTSIESIWETCRFEWCCSIHCETRKVN